MGQNQLKFGTKKGRNQLRGLAATLKKETECKPFENHFASEFGKLQTISNERLTTLWLKFWEQNQNKIGPVLVKQVEQWFYKRPAAGAEILAVRLKNNRQYRIHARFWPPKTAYHLTLGG